MGRSPIGTRSSLQQASPRMLSLEVPSTRERCSMKTLSNLEGRCSVGKKESNPKERESNLNLMRWV